MLPVLSIALPVFGLILIGGFVGKSGFLGKDATGALNMFVVYLSLPAVMFQAMAHIPPAQLANPSLFFAFCGGIAIPGALALTFALRGKEPLGNAAMQALSATFCNTGYMGIPLCRMAFGDDSLLPGVICMVIDVVERLVGDLRRCTPAAPPPTPQRALPPCAGRSSIALLAVGLARRGPFGVGGRDKPAVGAGAVFDDPGRRRHPMRSGRHRHDGRGIDRAVPAVSGWPAGGFETVGAARRRLGDRISYGGSAARLGRHGRADERAANRGQRVYPG